MFTRVLDYEREGARPMAVTISRSPRYPRISLLEAIQFAQKLYEGVHKSPVDAETAYLMMGFAGKNGSSSSALGALRQFNLVDGLRGDLRISELGMKIFEPSSPDEYADALRTAAESPDAFQAIKTQFNGMIPKADEPIRSFLIRSLDFSKAGADDCIKSLRRTLGEVESSATKNPQPDLSAIIDAEFLADIRSSDSDAHVRNSESHGDFSQENTSVKFMLTKTCAVTLNFTGKVTSKALERLIQHIELMTSAIDDAE